MTTPIRNDTTMSFKSTRSGLSPRKRVNPDIGGSSSSPPRGSVPEIDSGSRGALAMADIHSDPRLQPGHRNPRWFAVAHRRLGMIVNEPCGYDVMVACQLPK